MKKLLLGFMMLLAFNLFSQNAPVDFETGGFGAGWTWTVFENATNPPLEIIANPDVSAPNESATVAKFTALQAGQPWAGCESLHGSDIGTFNLDATNSTIKIMVWKPVVSDVGIKLVKPDGWSMGEIKVANTIVNGWEELTFDFTSQITEGYDQIVIFPDFDLAGRAQDNICYFDNITFSAGTAPAEPTVPAPDPTKPEANVISMFSDVYTDVPVDTWLTVWSEGALEEVLIVGNPTKKYTSVNFVGVETVGPNLIDASGMSHFHMDVWTPDANDFKIKLVDFGADGAWGGGDDSEHELTFPSPATGTWISYDIPLADFTGLTSTEHMAQLIMVKAPLGTIFVDNIYFWKSPTANAPIDFEAGGFGAGWTWTVFENATNPPLEIIANPDVSAPNESATVAKFTALQAGQPWAGCESLHGSDIGTFNLDATNSTIKIMVWKPVVSDVGIKLVKPDGWSMGEIKVANTIVNGWEELTFDFTSQITEGYDQIVIFPDFDLAGRAQDNICYFDNITFSAGTAPAEPTVAAPTPTQAPEDVISIYSDTYTNISGVDFNPAWGQSTIVTVDYLVAGDNTLRYENLNYQGTDWNGNPQDVSGHEYLHVDFWTANSTDLGIYLVSNVWPTNVEFEYVFTVLTNQWVSVDIPLSHFSGGGVDLADARQFKVEGDGDIWLDNLYFWKTPTSPFPTHAIDFETPGVGADWEWTVAENDDNPPLEFVANPGSGAPNTSATVAKFTARFTGNPWALCFTTDDGEFTFDAMNSTVKMMVYKPVISPVGFKVEGIGPATEIQVSNTVINAWEELTFDFSSVEGQTYSKLVIIPDFDFTPRAQENICYFDNIQVPDGVVVPPPPEPTVAAPDPTQAQENVTSIYSDEYTAPGNVNYFPNWGQSTTATEVTIEGNNTLKYAGLNYQGTTFDVMDVSSMEFLHVDYWTSDGSLLRVSPISVATGEAAYDFGTLTIEGWESVDIPISYFTSLGMSFNDIHQIKFDTEGTPGIFNLGTFFIDNVYFWKTPGPPTTWTGDIDNNWHEPGNWDNGIPDASTNVSIPSGLTNYPTIGAAASCNDITLVSDAGGTATLLGNSNLTVNGTATVQRYYATGGTTFDEWHLISAPTSDAQAGIYTGYYLQSYTESTNVWNDIIPTIDPMSSVQGFAFYAPNDGMTFDYVGTMGDGTYGLPISAAGPLSQHWNLFGNPYPSALDWDLVAPANVANLQSGAVYYLDQATGNYVSYNGGMGGGVRYVPPGQGFFVSGAIDSNPFTVNNSMRTHTGGSMYYKTDFENMLVLEATGNDFTDATYLRFDDGASMEVDQFDAYKLFTVTNPNLPQLYTVGGENLSINVLPETVMVSAGFRAGIPGEYTVNIKEVTGMTNVILEDLELGSVTDLMEDDYTFMYNLDDPDDRFIIHFTPMSVSENISELINIYSHSYNVYVNLPENTEGQVSVYNTMGQEIITSNVNETHNSITLNESGFYIVKVNIDGQQFSEKIFIK